jgi:hypothetical protein
MSAKMSPTFMNQKEFQDKFPNLINQKLFVVENRNIIGPMTEWFIEMGMEPFVSDDVPEDLALQMMINNISLGMIHATRINDFDPIHQASQNGAKIIVLVRDEPLWEEDANLNQRLVQSNIPIFRKGHGEKYTVNILKHLSEWINAGKFNYTEITDH